MKKCNTCNNELEYNCFTKDKSCKDGYGRKCKKCSTEYNKIHHINNKSKINQYHKEYYNNNKVHHIERMKVYELNNKSKINQYHKKYNNIKYNNSINDKIKALLRSRMWSAIRKDKSASSIKLLSCTTREFKQYLELQFKPEMNWDNHGTIWEIDHIIPCSKFDLTDPEQQKQCFHYSNLQPLFKTTAIAESLGYNNQIGNRNKNNKI